jgi:hypothetical protein
MPALQGVVTGPLPLVSSTRSSRPLLVVGLGPIAAAGPAVPTGSSSMADLLEPQGCSAAQVSTLPSIQGTVSSDTIE